MVFRQAGQNQTTFDLTDLLFFAKTGVGLFLVSHIVQDCAKATVLARVLTHPESIMQKGSTE